LTLDNAKNASERAAATRAANQHAHSEGTGLKAGAAASNNRNAEGVKAQDLGFAGKDENEQDCE
jgi:hypothetical protein